MSATFLPFQGDLHALRGWRGRSAALLRSQFAGQE
jgi:hypothetical protein